MVVMRLRVNCNSFIYLFSPSSVLMAKQSNHSISDNKEILILQHSPTLYIVKEHSILFDGGFVMHYAIAVLDSVPVVIITATLC